MLVGISRGVVGIGHKMQQVSQSKKQISRVTKNFSQDDFVLRKICFGERKKEEARERLMFVVHRSLLNQMFENLNVCEHEDVSIFQRFGSLAFRAWTSVMMCCCLLDSKASVMVLPRHLVTWLGPQWWTWGTHGHRPTTSLVNAKQKLLCSQSFFQHTSPRPTNFNVVWPKLLYNEPSYTCRIWLSGDVRCLA